MNDVSLLRIAVISDEISQDVSKAIELARRHNFNALEIRSAWNKAPLQLSKFDCQRILDGAQKAGLEIACFASPAFKTPLPINKDGRSTAMSVFEASVERAHWLGASVMRVFSFLRTGSPNTAAAAEEVGRVLRSAGRVSISIVVETGTKTNTPTAVTMCDFLSDLRMPDVGVLWDPGNGVFSGLEHFPYPQAYDLLKRHIRHVHVKDPCGTLRYTALGSGDVPWKLIVERLRLDSFQGFLSLETHYREGRELMPELLDAPYGTVFSDGGYEPSNNCMAVLAKMRSE